MRYFICIVLSCPSIALADELNIYDSVSRKDTVVVEYVDKHRVEHRLLVKKDELETKYQTIEDWMMYVRDKAE